MNEIIKILMGGISGGVIVAVYNSIITHNAEKARKEINALQNQIDKLYGPLYFWVSQNDICFKHNRAIMKAYDQVFSGQKWSDNELTQKKLQESCTATIDIGNEYVHQAEKNNEIIVKLLRENYSQIDLDDIDLFQEFILNYLRLKIEFTEEESRLKTPHRILEVLDNTVGTISYMKPEFIERVKQKFSNKRARLLRLTNNGGK